MHHIVVEECQMTHRPVVLAQILWPSFLAAGVLEMLVFSVVDPSHVSLGGWQPEVNTIYSLSFLVFWAVTAGSAGLSWWMRKAPAAIGAQRRSRRMRREAALTRHAHG